MAFVTRLWTEPIRSSKGLQLRAQHLADGGWIRGKSLAEVEIRCAPTTCSGGALFKLHSHMFVVFVCLFWRIPFCGQKDTNYVGAPLACSFWVGLKGIQRETNHVVGGDPPMLTHARAGDASGKVLGSKSMFLGVVPCKSAESFVFPLGLFRATNHQMKSITGVLHGWIPLGRMPLGFHAFVLSAHFEETHLFCLLHGPRHPFQSCCLHSTGHSSYAWASQPAASSEWCNDHTRIKADDCHEPVQETSEYAHEQDFGPSGFFDSPALECFVFLRSCVYVLCPNTAER